MSFNLKNRSFLKEIDFEPRELRFLLKLAEALKLAKYAGTEAKRLTGKEIALIFEKTSTRTRSAFEVASYDQGAHVTYLETVRMSVVTADEVVMREGPDASRREGPKLHAGHRAEILREDHGWDRVRLANKVEGWVPADTVDEI